MSKKNLQLHHLRFLNYRQQQRVVVKYEAVKDDKSE